jgi:hypothetical protein
MLQNYRLGLGLLVAGFGDARNGHIFSVEDFAGPATARRWDIPGYYAVGSGGPGALYMMAYRVLSPAKPMREALYYVTEGKFFGEFAGGVGLRTDLYVIRFGKRRLHVREERVEKKLMKLCERLQPRDLDKRGIAVLNEIQWPRPEGGPPFPKLKIKREGKEKKIVTEEAT